MNDDEITDSRFMVDEEGPAGVFGLFEDDGTTGWFYLYEPGGREIFDDLWIYNYPDRLGVSEHDVDVIWSENNDKCAVVIWGKIRGIYDLVGGKKLAAPLNSRTEPGIVDEQWIAGFEKHRTD